MAEICPEVATYWLVSILLVGLVSAAATRLGVGSRCQVGCQRLFYVSLALVGFGTIAAMLVGPGLCFASGATLTLMVLTATWDGRSAERYSY